MVSADGRWWLVFNGEIYNYLELRAELSGYPFRTRTDTEVLLAAWSLWGEATLERLVGMFAFLLWDTHTQTLTAVRDRFGVKPLVYHAPEKGRLAVASEIAAIEACSGALAPDDTAWATYLLHGSQSGTERTFWRDVRRLPAGHLFTWSRGEMPVIRQWYDLYAKIGDRVDSRDTATVITAYRALLDDAVRYRFRSDVPVGVAVSGGVDSSALLATIHGLAGKGIPSGDRITAYTFVTGDAAYDERPWVDTLLAAYPHDLRVVPLAPSDVPSLAADVWEHLREPYGGVATLAYAQLFCAARADGVTVLLDGQGMDEQWAGYDYYVRVAGAAGVQGAATVQGIISSPVRAHTVRRQFGEIAVPRAVSVPWADPVRAIQHRDIFEEKLPRALRYTDAVSMRASVELREPFLDHRLVELAFAQASDRKVSDGQGKWLLRRLLNDVLPPGITHAPKRPVQTPQREWLRGALASWAESSIEAALDTFGHTWLDADAVRASWSQYREHGDDNSFYVWQWITLGLMAQHSGGAKRSQPLK